MQIFHPQMKSFSRGGFIVDTPYKNQVSASAFVEEADNDPYGVLEEIIPVIVIVDMGKELDTEHIINIMMWTFHLTIDRGVIYTSRFNINKNFKEYLHEVGRSFNLSNFFYM